MNYKQTAIDICNGNNTNFILEDNDVKPLTDAFIEYMKTLSNDATEEFTAYKNSFYKELSAKLTDLGYLEDGLINNEYLLKSFNVLNDEEFKERRNKLKNLATPFFLAFENIVEYMIFLEDEDKLKGIFIFKMLINNEELFKNVYYNICDNKLILIWYAKYRFINGKEWQCYDSRNKSLYEKFI